MFLRFTGFVAGAVNSFHDVEAPLSLEVNE